jgi:hypothetical protein
VSNVLSEEKRQQVIALGRLGWPLRRIEQTTGVRRETAGTYLKEAGIAVRPPGSWGRRPPAKPANEVSTDSGPVPAPNRSPITSACEPFRARLAGGEAVVIDQILVNGLGVASLAERETPPGEEAQVDYGSGPMVRDPHSGRYRRTRMFALTLGYSRKAVRLLTFQSSAQTWAKLHEQAFRRLGGVLRTIVLDHLAEGVLKPDIYDPAINPLYRDVLAHYGVVALPCRVRDPDRKGKVERSVRHAQNTPLKGLRFESLAEAQTYLDRWKQNWADTRIHGPTKRQVAAMFAEEKPALLPLPLEPFRDYQFAVQGELADDRVDLAESELRPPLQPAADKAVRVCGEPHFQGGGAAVVGEQSRHGGRSCRSGPAVAAWSAERAGACPGPECDSRHAVVEQMYREQGPESIRRIQGLLGLARKHGAALHCISPRPSAIGPGPQS